MGFWSSVGSFVSGAVSATVGAVTSVVSAGFEAVKQVGSAVVSVMSNPLREKSKNWFGIIFEGVKGAIKGAKEGFSDGGLWGAVKGACKGGWDAAKEEYLRQADEEANNEIRRRREQYEHREKDEEYRRQQDPPIDISQDDELMQLSSAVNEFLPTLASKFKSSNKEAVTNFTEYLRIDISMLFIADIAERLSNMNSVKEISSGDRRLIGLVSKLIMDKDMSEAELQEFDGLVKLHYGKGLLLKGTERLFYIWTGEERARYKVIEENNKRLALLEVQIAALENYQKYGKALEPEQSDKLVRLREECNSREEEKQKDFSYYMDLKIVTGASEGLLQQAEKDDRGERLRDAERRRIDQAGVILENMARDIDTVRKTRKLVLSESDHRTLSTFADLYMPGAIKRKKTLDDEYVMTEVAA